MSGRIELMDSEQDKKPNSILVSENGLDGDRPKNRMLDSRVTFSDQSIDVEDLFPDGKEMRPSEESSDDPNRAAWDNKFQYMLAVISYAVGLGNVWRFPYLCQQNGGGAFLIPYCIMMIVEGMPLFLIEMGIGQRLRLGPIGLWNSIHPYLGGVGISSAVVSFLVGLYYNVIITWCFFYLGHSFQSPLPWGDCPKHENGTVYEECDKSSATVYFWYRNAIDTTESISDLGGLNWKMTLCLILAWVVVWVCIMKGIKTSGKVMYVTATFPYIVTTVFLVRALMLPGAGSGIAYMFTPNVRRLFDPRVWLDAATQIFYSMGLAFGGLIAFSSYNPPKNNVRKDVLTLSVANLVTSLYTAFVIFCILGYKGFTGYEKCIKNDIKTLASLYPNYTTSDGQKLIDMPVSVFVEFEKVNFSYSGFDQMRGLTSGCDFVKEISDAAEGTGLAFIVFTEAIVQFPGSPFWAIIFFLMLLMLGLGSMFGTLEGVITSIHDLKLFPWLKKPVLTGILCAFSCTVGLIFATRAGEYWVKLFDSFAGSYALMAVAFFEVMGVVYVYGWERFCRDIEWMTGEKPGRYWTTTWRFVSPVIMFGLFFASLIMSFFEPNKYHAYHVDDAKPHPTDYPPWCMFIAGFLVLSAMLPVPFVFFVRYFKIWRFEGDIPAAARCLNTTTSTAQILKSQQSFNSNEEFDTSRPDLAKVETTYTP